MITPNISNVQGIISDLISAHAAKPGSLLAGVPVAREEFGFMDPTSDTLNADKVVEDALSESGPGMALLIAQPIGTTGSSELNGRTVITCILVVFLLVNTEQNERGTGGLNRNPLAVVREIWAATVGKSIGPTSFKLGPSPIGISEDGQAIRTYPVDLQCTLIV